MKQNVLLSFFTKTVLICSVILASFSVKAQDNLIGVNAGLEVAQGDFSEIYGIGFGGGLHYKRFVNDNAAFGINLSYATYSPKEFPGIKYSNLSNIGLTGIAEYYFLDDAIRPYGGIEAGYNIISWDAEGTGISIGETDTRIGLGLKGGVLFEVSDVVHLTGELGYNLFIATSGTDREGNSNVDADAPSFRTFTVKVGCAFMF